MDALDLLIADHNRFRGLFARFGEARKAGDTDAAALFEDLRAHTTIEERAFYPSVREADAELADIITEGVEEHHIDEEESDMFPQVRGATDAATRERWGERLERAKAELGAPTMADADGLTIEELRRLASEQQIPGRSTMDREELTATVDAR